MAVPARPATAPQGPGRGFIRVPRDPRRFPLIEVMMVLVVIVMLTAFALASYRRQVLRARAAATLQELVIVRIALIQFQADCGGLPAWSQPGGDPGVCYAPAGTEGRWDGPYLRSWPTTTPLGGRIVYMARRGAGDAGSPAIRVDDLSPDAASMLAGLVSNAFASGSPRAGGVSAAPGAVSFVLGQPADVIAGGPDEVAGRRVVPRY